MASVPLNSIVSIQGVTAELEDLLHALQNVKAEEVTPDVLSHWASSLDSAIHTLKNDGPKCSPSSKLRLTSASSRTTAHTVGDTSISSSKRSMPMPKERETSTFPTALDRNKKEPRVVTHALSQVAQQKIHHCAIAILAVLESVLHQVNCDLVSLATPYRGHDYEFRCLCALSREKHAGAESGGGDCMAFTGTGIIRGKDSVEYAAFSSGYVINTCPKAYLLLGEDGQGDSECVSLVELMEDPYRRRCVSSGGRNPNGSSVGSGSSGGSQRRDGGGVGATSACHGPSVARLCCPVKSSGSTAPIGLLTVTLEGSIMFNAEAENFVFDAATTIGTLLSRCADLSTLQACFAKGNLREELPAFSPKLVDLPDPRTQLVYRITNMAATTVVPPTSAKSGGENGHSTTHRVSFPRVEGDNGYGFAPSPSVRLVNPESGKIEKVREGSPLKNVLFQMERLQLSWFAAVRLNVELKQKCEAQERYVSLFLQQNRAALASM